MTWLEVRGSVTGRGPTMGDYHEPLARAAPPPPLRRRTARTVRDLRGYANALARRLGNRLTLSMANDLLVWQLLCRLAEALPTGAEEIGEP